RANGCLEVVPGSHRQGLKRVLRMTANGFEPVGASGNDDPRPRDLLEMGRGDVALVHGRAQHASGPNHSSRPRPRLITHFMSGASRLAPTAWIQRPPGGFPDEMSGRGTLGKSLNSAWGTPIPFLSRLTHSPTVPAMDPVTLTTCASELTTGRAPRGGHAGPSLPRGGGRT